MPQITRNGKVFLDVHGAATALKLSEHWVRVLIRFGQIPAVKLNGRYWIAQVDLSKEINDRGTPVPVVPQKGGHS